MPGKSRRGRGKYSAQSKKKRSTLARVARQPEAAETYQPAAGVLPSPSPSMPATVTKPAGIQYPYITIELRRIGIMSGIMLAILVVLALVLP